MMSETKIKGKEGLAVKNTCRWAGEPAHWLRVLAALIGDSGPVSSTTGWLTISNFRDPPPSSEVCGCCNVYCARTFMQTNCSDTFLRAIVALARIQIQFRGFTW